MNFVVEKTWDNDFTFCDIDLRFGAGIEIPSITDTILTPPALNLVTASRTLHPTRFKSCVFYPPSVFLLFKPLLSSNFFVWSVTALYKSLVSMRL